MQSKYGSGTPYQHLRLSCLLLQVLLKIYFVGQWYYTHNIVLWVSYALCQFSPSANTWNGAIFDNIANFILCWTMVLHAQFAPKKCLVFWVSFLLVPSQCKWFHFTPGGSSLFIILVCTQQKREDVILLRSFDGRQRVAGIGNNRNCNGNNQLIKYLLYDTNVFITLASSVISE